LRLTNQLVAGYDTYGFTPPGDFPEVVAGIRNGDYPAGEFFLGGKIVKDMEKEHTEELRGQGVSLERDPRKTLAIAGEKAFPSGRA
jgi:CRISPR-associated protein Cst2